MGLPHFGGEQPGDTYYFSPLSLYCFGIVDVTSTPDILHAFGYTEDQGGKGGNNVASLLIYCLTQLGWLIEGSSAMRLSIIMDNCSGQNKNNHVLRLSLWLVELGFFHQVEFIFYVRGHTKNVCDRMFNLLKKRYHKDNIFSITHLTTLLNAIDNVNYQHMQGNIFFDYNSLLDNFYKQMRPGSVTQNHYFWVNSTEPTTMFMKTFDDDEDDQVEIFDHAKNNNQDRLQQMWSLYNNNNMKRQLTAPGLKEIKMVELWKKWGKFVPLEFREELCPKPSDDVIKRVSKDRSTKSTERARSRRVQRSYELSQV